MNILLTDRDIERNFRNIRIMLYSDIHQYSKIEDLFKPYYNKIVILYINQKIGNKTVGHWVGLTKRGEVIVYFDPYGFYVDKPLDTYSQSHKLDTNQDHTYLIRLFLDYLRRGNRGEYNELHLQKMSPNITTCGFHCSVYFYFFDRGFTLTAYQNYIRRETNLKNVDRFVVNFFNNIINNRLL